VGNLYFTIIGRLFGNYSQTFRGWFKVLERTAFLNKEIQYPIVEEFKDSPFSGTPDTEWESILYFSVI